MMPFDEVLKLAGDLPGTVVITSYGTLALKVKAKRFARRWEDETTLVLKVPLVVREHLLSTSPDTFFITDHYRDYPWVLVRLALVRRKEMLQLLQESWRQVAPSRLVAAYDARS